MERRDFLQMMALAAPALTVSGRLFAAPPGSPRFLLVFPRGGYDCANVVIPYSSAYYYESRPNIAVSKDSIVQLDSNWGLTPALRESIAPMYANRQALFIPFAGTDDLARSHFETQDSIELGQPLQGAHDLRSGFLARLAAEVNGASPISFTDSLPVCFRGDSDIPNISLKGVAKPVFDSRQASILSDMYAGHHLQQEIA